MTKTPSMTKTPYEIVLDVLNSALQADRTAITNVLQTRFSCNQQLFEHPDVPVADDGSTYCISGLGLLNGILQALQLPRVAGVVYESELQNAPTAHYKEFVPYQPPATVPAAATASVPVRPSVTASSEQLFQLQGKLTLARQSRDAWRSRARARAAERRKLLDDIRDVLISHGCEEAFESPAKLVDDLLDELQEHKNALEDLRGTLPSEQLQAEAESHREYTAELEGLLLEFVTDIRVVHGYDAVNLQDDWPDLAETFCKVVSKLRERGVLEDPPKSAADYVVLNYSVKHGYLRVGLLNVALLGRACPDYMKYRGTVYKFNHATGLTAELLSNGIHCVLEYAICPAWQGTPYEIEE